MCACSSAWPRTTLTRTRELVCAGRVSLVSCDSSTPSAGTSACFSGHVREVLRSLRSSGGPLVRYLALVLVLLGVDHLVHQCGPVQIGQNLTGVQRLRGVAAVPCVVVRAEPEKSAGEHMSQSHSHSEVESNRTWMWNRIKAVELLTSHEHHMNTTRH
jgi:hypothetical protein